MRVNKVLSSQLDSYRHGVRYSPVLQFTDVPPVKISQRSYDGWVVQFHTL